MHGSSMSLKTTSPMLFKAVKSVLHAADMQSMSQSLLDISHSAVACSLFGVVLLAAAAAVGTARIVRPFSAYFT